MSATPSRRLRRFVFAALTAVAALGAATSSAGAATPTPTPIGDDAGFVQFAAVGKRVAVAYFDRALATPGLFDRFERRRLTLARRAAVTHASRVNAVLGDDAVRAGDFSIVLPALSFAGPGRALLLGERIERLLLGVYLNGAAYSDDAATRLLLGRLAASAVDLRQALRALRGAPPVHGLASPIDLDVAGARLDAFLALPA